MSKGVLSQVLVWSVAFILAVATAVVLWRTFVDDESSVETSVSEGTCEALCVAWTTDESVDVGDCNCEEILTSGGNT